MQTCKWTPGLPTPAQRGQSAWMAASSFKPRSASRWRRSSASRCLGGPASCRQIYCTRIGFVGARSMNRNASSHKQNIADGTRAERRTHIVQIDYLVQHCASYHAAAHHRILGQNTTQLPYPCQLQPKDATHQHQKTPEGTRKDATAVRHQPAARKHSPPRQGREFVLHKHQSLKIRNLCTQSLAHHLFPLGGGGWE